MREFLFITLYLFSSLSYGRDGVGCVALETPSTVMALFPVVKERAAWDWYRIQITPERTEYAWIAEPGVFAMEEGARGFRGNGMAFAISLGSANLKTVTPGRGSLVDLVKLTQKNAYYTKKPETEAESDRLLNFIHYSQVGGKIVDNDAIVVGTLDRATTDVAKTGNPTHLKMQAILPYPGESYECFAKIEKISRSW
ncbi:hypothetical protein [Burkholderia sp. Bp9004]|uniref:hypothetical protein n=1 Tax=Burkholderia sp. Bp9004 TaxID=2184559 RepID=UPI000F5FD35D|nr:hypothetical protein [Burkholderia sp. Bp9004]